MISSKRHRNLLPLPATTNRLIGVEGDTDADVVDTGDATADRGDVGVIPGIPAYAGAVASVELRRSRDGNVNPVLSTVVDDKIGWAEDRTTRICSMSPEFAESAQPSDTCIFGAGVYQPGPG